VTPEEYIKAIESAERAERITRGLPPDHILNWSEYPFTFAKDAVTTFRTSVNKWHASKPSAGSALYCAMAAAAQADYHGANALMKECERLEQKNGKARMRFGHTPQPAGEPLPAVHGSYPTAGGLFLGCDLKYFAKYGIPLLVSLSLHSNKAPIHIHFFGSDPSGVSAVLSRINIKSSLTYEDASAYIERTSIAPERYFHAARLIRFAEAIEQSTCPLWMADVDALATGPLPETKRPLALRVRAGRIEPWNQFSACLVNGSRDSLPYFRRVSEILKADLPHAWWGMDQYALYSAWLALKPEIDLIGPDLASVTEDTPGVLWFTAGSSKLSLASSNSAYAQLYRRYAES